MQDSASDPPSRKLGRPRKTPDSVRLEELRLYLSLAEKRSLDDDAHAAGLRAAEYVRRLITGHRPASSDGTVAVKARLLVELNAIGIALRKALDEQHPALSQDDWEQLVELLKAALERVAFGDERVC